ncbi:MAG TPA: hypothetical protein PKL96_05805 [Bacteroidales bacterium]|nr:hypothetical protein [Bacteroidales bacterium]
MKLIKLTILFSFVLFLMTEPVFAQYEYYSDSSSKTDINNFKNKPSLFNNKRLGVSMEMGAGISGSKYGAGAYTYVSPFLSYKVTPKFRLDVGASYIQGFNNSGINEFYFGKNPAYLSVFARGNYLVSDKLMISGAVYKTFDLNQAQTTDLNSQKRSLNNYGIMVGAEYKVTENLIIGAQLNFSDRNPAYYPGSYYNQNDVSPGFHHGMNPYHGLGGIRPYYGFGGW